MSDRLPWWYSDNVVDAVGFLLSALPWALPGPSTPVRIGAVGACAVGWQIARFVTKSLELGVFVFVVSVLTRFCFAMLG